MQAILSDHCIDAQVRVVVAILAGPYWQEIWNSLNLWHHTFRDVGLGPDAPDSEVWDFCQREKMALVTANRNHDGPDSLENMIRTRNASDSFPIFTIGDADEVLLSRSYAERVAERLIDALLAIDNIRGAGRIWLP